MTGEPSTYFAHTGDPWQILAAHLRNVATLPADSPSRWAWRIKPAQQPVTALVAMTPPFPIRPSEAILPPLNP